MRPRNGKRRVRQIDHFLHARTTTEYLSLLAGSCWDHLSMRVFSRYSSIACNDVAIVPSSDRGTETTPRGKSSFLSGSDVSALDPRSRTRLISLLVARALILDPDAKSRMLKLLLRECWSSYLEPSDIKEVIKRSVRI